MSVASTPRSETPSRPAPSPTFADRFLTAVPLLSVYAWLCMIYVFEASKRVTPWLFTDELELTQLSRSIAATGHAARRGQPHPFGSLYPYLIAPLWLIHDVATAYSGIKYLDVFVMAAAVFPTYLLARLVADRRLSLFAAAAAGAIPSLAYSSYIVEETLAYPYAALCLYLIAKALVEWPNGRRARWWAAAAVVAAAVAPAVRAELVMIPIGLLFTLIFVAWSSEWARRRRRAWSIGDWIGTLTLAFGAIFFVSGYLSRKSLEWYGVTTFYKHRVLIMGNWAVASLVTGIGVIPFVGGLAALFRARGEERSRELRMVRCVMLGGFLAFGLYTAMKAAYLSTQFATRVEERNIIYVSPLLFVGTALVLARRRVNVPALVGAAALAAYLVGYALYHVVQFPYEMNVQLYSDALGLAILQQANRYLYWTPNVARWVLLGILLAGTAALFALPLMRARARLAGAIVAILAVGIVAWNLTGEIGAAAGTISIGRSAANTLHRPFTWVDDVAGGKPTLYLGEGEADQNPEWMLEFWNRSIVSVGSLDATVNGPGPAGAPNLTKSGQLFWTNDPTQPGPTYDYAVEDWPCVDLAGTVRGTHLFAAGGRLRAWRLVALTHPNRLVAMCSGIYPDGWTGAADSAYYRFSSSGHGWLRVIVSRRDGGGNSGPSPVHIFTGPLLVNQNHQPVLAQATRRIDLTIDTSQTKVCWVPMAAKQFGAYVVVDKKFVPKEIDPTSSDGRTLGAEVSYRYFTQRPRVMQSTCK
ncbi:MAG: hypothetical protein QOF75_1034 [Gaiellaceae bacterium]|jgi:hypothetical protein|nr:hypothetical protein [Gaiellaceae bacterium]MDX6472448.1 hypothetical protein [Gaiellaceae bacterium]